MVVSEVTRSQIFENSADVLCERPLACFILSHFLTFYTAALMILARFSLKLPIAKYFIPISDCLYLILHHDGAADLGSELRRYQI